jgi:hypothetical protein
MPLCSGLFGLTLAAAVLLPDAGARAFDMSGFQGGMSVDAFVAHGRAQGYAVTVSGMAGDDLPPSAWTREQSLGASLVREASPKRLSAFLCGGRLKSLSEISDGSIDAFVREVAAAQERFAATGVAGKAISRRVTPKHFISSLAVTWPDASAIDTYTVEIVSASGSAAVHRGWSTKLEGCE